MLNLFISVISSPEQYSPLFQDWVRLKCGISNTDKINLQISKDRDQVLISIFTIQEFSVLDIEFHFI